ncbi:hypothetical protein YB2330_004166 [Saitoella coloradoensis]
MDPILNLVAQNIPEPFREPAAEILTKVIGSQCSTLTASCLKLAISKALGSGIVAASSIVKVPQILSILSAGSGAGISLLSYLLETTSFLISLAYNFRNGFPFSTYGETVFMCIQNLVITLLILHFGRKAGLGAGVLALFASAGYALFNSNYIPHDLLSTLQLLTIPISLGSKIPQILTNARNGSTGQLSAFAVFNYLAGSLARLYTTLTEVDDPLIFWGFLLSTGLNIVLASQVLMYWGKKGDASKAKKRQ